MANRNSQRGGGSHYGSGGGQDRGYEDRDRDEGRYDQGGLHSSRDPMSGGYRDFDAPGREMEYGGQRGGYGSDEGYGGSEYGGSSQYGQGGPRGGSNYD